MVKSLRALWAPMLLLTACKLDIKTCASDSQCPQGQRCNESFECAPTTPDADAGDGGTDEDLGQDTGLDTGIDAGDGGFEVGGPDVGQVQHDASRPPGQVQLGLPHVNGDDSLGDLLLLHFDEPINAGAPPRNQALSSPRALTCDGGCPDSLAQGAYRSAAQFNNERLVANESFTLTPNVGFGMELWLSPSAHAPRACLIELLFAGSRRLALCLDQGVPVLLDEAQTLIQNPTAISAAPGTWTHVALIKDADPCTSETFVALYINGVQTATATTADRMIELDQIRVGGGASESYSGAMDEVRFAPRNFYESELSIHQRPGCLVYSTGDNRQLKLSDSRANVPNDLPYQGAFPRLDSNAQRLGFVRCEAQECNVVVIGLGDLSVIASTTHGEALEYQGSFDEDETGFYYIRGADPCTRSIYRLDLMTGDDQLLPWSETASNAGGWYAVDAARTVPLGFDLCVDALVLRQNVLIGLRSDACVPSEGTQTAVTALDPRSNPPMLIEEPDLTMPFFLAGVRMDRQHPPLVLLMEEGQTFPRTLLHDSAYTLSSPALFFEGFRAQTPSAELFRLYGLATASMGPVQTEIFLQGNGTVFNSDAPLAKQLTTRVGPIHSMDYAPLAP